MQILGHHKELVLAKNIPRILTARNIVRSMQIMWQRKESAFCEFIYVRRWLNSSCGINCILLSRIKASEFGSVRFDFAFEQNKAKQLMPTHGWFVFAFLFVSFYPHVAVLYQHRADVSSIQHTMSTLRISRQATTRKRSNKLVSTIVRSKWCASFEQYDVPSCNRDIIFPDKRDRRRCRQWNLCQKWLINSEKADMKGSQRCFERRTRWSSHINVCKVKIT